MPNLESDLNRLNERIDSNSNAEAKKNTALRNSPTKNMQPTEAKESLRVKEGYEATKEMRIEEPLNANKKDTKKERITSEERCLEVEWKASEMATGEKILTMKQSANS
jgi:hypothetical protein